MSVGHRASFCLLVRASRRAPGARALTSITYSGGQASEGQGGFYGSGGARAKTKPTEWNSKAVAEAKDIQRLESLMEEVSKIDDIIAGGESLSPKVIENKQAMKKLLTSPSTTELLDRLEIGGQPIWGLSQRERILVKEARKKALNC